MITTKNTIDQDLISEIDQYIEKHEGITEIESVSLPKRVQQQTVRFGDDMPLQANTPISMLIPLAINPHRRDAFMGFDDCTAPIDNPEPYPQYEESFAECLRKYLICKTPDDISICENANLSPQQWTELATNKGYKPHKRTAVAIALALHLNIDETMDLLKAASFELSHCRVFDLIIEYCINNELYDVSEVNEILFEFRQPLLC